MKVTVEGETIQIVFIKEHLKYKYGQFAGKDQLNTICKLFRLSKTNSHPICVSTGRGNLSHLDKYDKIKGKKFALAEAFKLSSWPFFTKEVREQIWDKFKKEFNIIKNKK
jgi:hypothetical protein